MVKGHLYLSLPALLLFSCQGIVRAPRSSGIDPEPFPSEESTPISEEYSESSVDSEESESLVSSGEESVVKKETNAGRVSEPLADSLIRLGEQNGFLASLGLNASIALQLDKNTQVKMELEGLSASFDARHNKSKKDILIPSGDEGDIAVPYLEAELKTDIDHIIFTTDVESPDRPGRINTLSASLAGYCTTSYLLGKDAYFDFSDFVEINDVISRFIEKPVDLFPILEPILHLLVPSVGKYRLEPFTAEIGSGVATIYDNLIPIKEKLIDTDAAVVEAALGFLTEYAHFYREGDIYSIEVPSTYSSLGSVLETLNDFGLLGEKRKDFDGASLVSTYIPNLDEDGKIALYFDGHGLFYLEANLETGLDLSKIFEGEEELPFAINGLATSLRLDLGEFKPIGQPDPSKYTDLN